VVVQQVIVMELLRPIGVDPQDPADALCKHDTPDDVVDCARCVRRPLRRVWIAWSPPADEFDCAGARLRRSDHAFDLQTIEVSRQTD
jgi:hypothetical protein